MRRCIDPTAARSFSWARSGALPSGRITLKSSRLSPAGLRAGGLPLFAVSFLSGFGSATDWVSNLAGFEIELLRDGAVVDRGQAANVLDGPLSALRQLVGLLARDPVNPPLATGDIATTGTLTRAFPILPGESWSTTLHGIELGGRPVWFA
jgi:hypothetical protein